jgi:hypothetical protein
MMLELRDDVSSAENKVPVVKADQNPRPEWLRGSLRVIVPQK